MPDLHDFGNSFSNVILQASFDDRLKSDEGFLSATGDLCTLTAGSGKDLYLTAAKVTFFANTTGIGGATETALGDEIVLKVNGTIMETSKHSGSYNVDGAGNLTTIYEFRNLFHKAGAGEILKLEVITLDAETDVEGFIQAIEVPSGENPLKYTGE